MLCVATAKPLHYFSQASSITPGLGQYRKHTQHNHRATALLPPHPLISIYTPQELLFFVIRYLFLIAEDSHYFSFTLSLRCCPAARRRHSSALPLLPAESERKQLYTESPLSPSYNLGENIKIWNSLIPNCGEQTFGVGHSLSGRNYAALQLLSKGGSFSPGWYSADLKLEQEDEREKLSE